MIGTALSKITFSSLLADRRGLWDTPKRLRLERSHARKRVVHERREIKGSLD
jgi:hypothetical protein